MSEHITHMSELNDGAGADIETGIMPLVKFLNKMGVETTASSENVDGAIAFVTVRPRAGEGFEPLVNVLFRQIQPMVFHLEDVHVEVMFSNGYWVGVLRLPIRHLDEVTKRVGCWLEMLHK